MKFAQDNNKISPEAIMQFKENSSWYLILGLLLVVLGSLAIIFSAWSTIVSVIYLGSMLVALGLFKAIKAYKVSKWSNFFLNIFLSVLYTVFGFFIVFYPGINAITLTLFFAILFIISGITRIIFAIGKYTPQRGLLIINGIITLILGGLIWYQWPSSGLWVIGTFVGIEAIFTGFNWIMLSLHAKELKIEE